MDCKRGTEKKNLLEDLSDKGFPCCRKGRRDRCKCCQVLALSGEHPDSGAFTYGHIGQSDYGTDCGFAGGYGGSEAFKMIDFHDISL